MDIQLTANSPSNKRWPGRDFGPHAPPKHWMQCIREWTVDHEDLLELDEYQLASMNEFDRQLRSTGQLPFLPEEPGAVADQRRPLSPRSRPEGSNSFFCLSPLKTLRILSEKRRREQAPQLLLEQVPHYLPAWVSTESQWPPVEKETTGELPEEQGNRPVNSPAWQLFSGNTSIDNLFQVCTGASSGNNSCLAPVFENSVVASDIAGVNSHPRKEDSHDLPPRNEQAHGVCERLPTVLGNECVRTPSESPTPCGWPPYIAELTAPGPWKRSVESVSDHQPIEPKTTEEENGGHWERNGETAFSTRGTCDFYGAPNGDSQGLWLVEGRDNHPNKLPSQTEAVFLPLRIRGDTRYGGMVHGEVRQEPESQNIDRPFFPRNAMSVQNVPQWQTSGGRSRGMQGEQMQQMYGPNTNRDWKPGERMDWNVSPSSESQPILRPPLYSRLSSYGCAESSALPGGAQRYEEEYPSFVPPQSFPPLLSNAGSGNPRGAVGASRPVKSWAIMFPHRPAPYEETHRLAPREALDTQQPGADQQQQMVLSPVEECSHPLNEGEWENIQRYQQNKTGSSGEGFCLKDEYPGYTAFATGPSVRGVPEGQHVWMPKQRMEDAWKREERRDGVRYEQERVTVAERGNITVRASETITEAFATLLNAERGAAAASRKKEQQEERVEHWCEQQPLRAPNRGSSVNMVGVGKTGRRRRGKKF
ncbi:hypothetical protein TGME49_252350 [Toxoplasma gondii ME49]|uniref:Uncharacterized protein n=1 Tax=Toxoplasma gondii (strain ATCC 50611 / Me49) TaxID=508771 RepID=S8FAS1_TOXGM|nr:hypothetical protein TGME49_252350 [Toxoplasma gondii ME49]EPT31872.1 hypothetical protein TGME49_252350 [Toxoplasma gondii ME49]|eukprot:XP_018638209.1 hypothetical protein TGME49_252350 [Toxoplasma gondii ME49]